MLSRCSGGIHKLEVDGKTLDISDLSALGIQFIVGTSFRVSMTASHQTNVCDRPPSGGRSTWSGTVEQAEGTESG